MKWAIAFVVIAVALLWALRVENVAESSAKSFCAGINVGDALEDIAKKPGTSGDMRIRQINPDSVAVIFTGISSFSRHVCDIRAEKAVIVEKQYIYLD